MPEVEVLMDDNRQSDVHGKMLSHTKVSKQAASTMTLVTGGRKRWSVEDESIATRHVENIAENRENYQRLLRKFTESVEMCSPTESTPPFIELQYKMASN